MDCILGYASFIWMTSLFFSNNFKEHLDRLQRIFERIRQNGLKLSPKKCSYFFQKKVKYLWHIVSEMNIEAHPDKIEKGR